MGVPRRDHTVYLICAALIIITAVIFSQVSQFDFINLDDPSYVYENPHIAAGFSHNTLVWAFTTTREGAWQPLVWLSYLVDHEMDELNAGTYHTTNLILHVANVLLLFLLFLRITGAKWKSAFIAALFAIHPLHVEPVAWIASRKDVLSTLLWLLTLMAYARYVSAPCRKRYALVVVAYVLAVMSKPMVMTLPIIMLLLDYWPLERMKSPIDGKLLLRLVKEKIPLLIISGFSLAFAFAGQISGRSLGTLGQYPLGVRLANAVLSYFIYIVRTIWPTRLALYYPHPLNSIPVLYTVGSVVFLAVVSLLIARAARTRRYLLVGWLWYIVMLVPVSGIVQFGHHANADRFMYLPLVGLAIIAAWGVCDLARSKPVLPATLGLLAVVASAVVAYPQVGYWRNSLVVWKHAIDVTNKNAYAHCAYASALSKNGQIDASVAEYWKTIEIDPKSVQAHYNLGSILDGLGATKEAMAQYETAIKLDPQQAQAHSNLGLMELQQGKVDEAIAHYRAAIRAQPDYEIARINLGIALKLKAERDKASHSQD